MLSLESATKTQPVNNPETAAVFSLPDEIMLQILSHLSVRSVINASEVCVWWHSVTQEVGLWKRLIIQDFNEILHIFEAELRNLASVPEKQAGAHKFICLREYLIRHVTYIIVQFGTLPTSKYFTKNTAIWRFMLSRHFPHHKLNDKYRARSDYQLNVYNNKIIKMSLNLSDKFCLVMRTGYLQAFEYLIGQVNRNAQQVKYHGSFWANTRKKLSKRQPTIREFINQHHQNGATLLSLAASFGHLHLVKRLVELGADINKANLNGITALQCAAEGKHMAVLNWLLTSGADYEATTSKGETVLYLAVIWGDYDLVLYLLEKIVRPEKRRAIVNAAENNGVSPLHIAAEKGDDKLVLLLLKHGANTESIAKYKDKRSIAVWQEHNITPLYLAAREGHLTVIECLLNAGANTDAEIFNDRDFPIKYNCLYAAFRNGHDDVVKCLLRAGADFSKFTSVLYEYMRASSSETVESFENDLIRFAFLQQEIMQEQREKIAELSQRCAQLSKFVTRPLLQGIISMDQELKEGHLDSQEHPDNFENPDNITTTKRSGS